MVVALAVLGVSLSMISGAHAQATSAGQAPAANSKEYQAAIDKDVELLRQDLRSGRKDLIAANLSLTDAEATKFWPVYDQYAAEGTKLGDEKYALLKEYAIGFGTLTDEQAMTLAKRSLALDESIAQLRSKYLPIVNKVLPGKKAATFFQMDRRISSVIDLQIASQIPLVQDQK
jgi:hypothetical protein